MQRQGMKWNKKCKYMIKKSRYFFSLSPSSFRSLFSQILAIPFRSPFLFFSLFLSPSRLLISSFFSFISSSLPLLLSLYPSHPLFLPSSRFLPLFSFFLPHPSVSLSHPTHLSQQRPKHSLLHNIRAWWDTPAASPQLCNGWEKVFFSLGGGGLCMSEEGVGGYEGRWMRKEESQIVKFLFCIGSKKYFFLEF